MVPRRQRVVKATPPTLPMTSKGPTMTSIANSDTDFAVTVLDEFDEHGIQRSRNLGQYRTRYVCWCGAEWIVDGDSDAVTPVARSFQPSLRVHAMTVALELARQTHG